MQVCVNLKDILSKRSEDVCVFFSVWQQRSAPLIVTWPSLRYSEGQQTACVKNKKPQREKSIGFHYVVGQCHWPVNDPVTAAGQG